MPSVLYNQKLLEDFFFFKLHFYLPRDTFPEQSYWEDFIPVLCKEQEDNPVP